MQSEFYLFSVLSLFQIHFCVNKYTLSTMKLIIKSSLLLQKSALNSNKICNWHFCYKCFQNAVINKAASP